MNTFLGFYILLVTGLYHFANGQACNNVCEWLPWSEWGDCLVSCGGGGVQLRKRPFCCPIDSSDLESCMENCNKNRNDSFENRTCGDVCLHGGSMKIDGSGCQCMNRTFGHCCEELLPSCTPFPTDVIFVLDSSVSQSEEQFGKQLDFILQFIEHVNISEEEFQIAVVTFSFEARVEVNFNQSTDKDSLLKLIKEIQFRPGATFTDKGLEAASEVARQSERREGMVTLTYAFVLTDGMSTRRDYTRNAAKALRNDNVHVIAIGIGKEVSHQELIDIASPGDQYSPSYVFSVEDFNALYTLLKQLVDITCDDCDTLRHYSDIVFLLYEGNEMNQNEFEISIDAMTSIVMNTDNVGEHEGPSFALVQISNEMKSVIQLSNQQSQNDIFLKLQVIHKSETEACSKDEPCSGINVTAAINETFHSFDNNAERQGARKFLIVLTNGKFEKPNKIKEEMTTFYDTADAKVFVVGVGPDVNMEGVLALAKEAIDVFVTRDNDEESKLTVMQSEFTYNVCMKH